MVRHFLHFFIFKDYPFYFFDGKIEPDITDYLGGILI